MIRFAPLPLFVAMQLQFHWQDDTREERNLIILSSHVPSAILTVLFWESIVRIFHVGNKLLFLDIQ